MVMLDTHHGAGWGEMPCPDCSPKEEAMLHFRMTVHVDNAAFQDSAADELARILRQTADRVERFGTGGKVMDINGNSCGSWKIR